MINAGTTTLAVSVELARNPDLTVITNSIDIASRFVHGVDGGRRMYLLGGNVGQDSQTFGDITRDEIERFQVDHAILTIGGLNEERIFFGFSTEVASVARAMMKWARIVTAVVPNPKFGRTDLVKMCLLPSIEGRDSKQTVPANRSIGT